MFGCVEKTSIILSKTGINKSFKSSVFVASAPITVVFNFSASALVSPILIATGVFVRITVAPSSWALSATFQAMDFESNAPKIIPFFPLSKK